MAGIQPETMVAPGPFDAPASIVYLSEDHAAGDSATGIRIICDPVLGTAKQYISRTCSGNAGQEASPGGTKCQRDVPLRTGTHESGGCSRVGERYNPGQCVEGIPGHFLVGAGKGPLRSRRYKTCWALLSVYAHDGKTGASRLSKTGHAPAVLVKR